MSMIAAIIAVLFILNTHVSLELYIGCSILKKLQRKNLAPIALACMILMILMFFSCHHSF